MAEDKKKTQEHQDVMREILDSFKYFSDAVSKSEKALRHKVNRAARFEPDENILRYKAQVDFNKVKSKIAVQKLEIAKLKIPYLGLKQVQYHKFKLKLSRTNNPIKPLNILGSTYESTLGSDASDELNEIKIKKNLTANLLEDHARELAKQEQNGLLKQFREINRLNKRIKLYKNFTKLNYNLKANAPFENLAKRAELIKNYTNQLDAYKKVANIRVLKGLNLFGNVASIINFGFRDPKDDENKLKYYSGLANAIKGAFDIGVDYLPSWPKKISNAAKYLSQTKTYKNVYKIFNKGLRTMGKISRLENLTSGMKPGFSKMYSKAPPFIRTGLKQIRDWSRFNFMNMKVGAKLGIENMVGRGKSLFSTIGRFSKWAGPKLLKLTKSPAFKLTRRIGARAVGALSFIADMSEVYLAKTQKEKAKKLGNAMGGAAGVFLGAKAGAAIGTLIGGPVGTVIGGVVGGAAGYLIGSGIGAKIAGKFQKQVMSVWNPIEKYTRKYGTIAWNGTKSFVTKRAQELGKFWNKNKKTILKYTGGAAASLLVGGPLGLLGYATGSIAENLISNALQKPKKSSLNQDLQTANKVNSLYNVNNTNSIDCRQVAAQMISELNKVLQNKVISHTANYA